ncbi:MAG TPA: spore maturation protein [Firmicutes bacterium]|nr:spore maturation protein [Bacillota bacterium]
MMTATAQVTALIVPALVVVALLAALLRKVDVFEEFVRGAGEGVKLSLQLIPYIVAIFVAVGLFRESGVLTVLTQWLSPVLTWLGFPVDVLPLMIIRPFNNAAAMGVVADILSTRGPDSFSGRLASVMQGSSETTFYVLTVYLGAVGIKRSLHALPLCLLGDLIGYLAALWATVLFFGR